MMHRREFIGRGLAAVAMGLASRRIIAADRGVLNGPSIGAMPGPIDPNSTRPFRPVMVGPGESVLVDGMPFAPWFTGDDFANPTIPFHFSETQTMPGGVPPEPQEQTDVVIVGGGVGGLATAYALRHRHPVVFEVHRRFGGVSQGETWNGVNYSLGGAYGIIPDKGNFIDQIYSEMGLYKVSRIDAGENPTEYYGKILEDYFDVPGRPPEEAAAFKRYREVVIDMAENHYPDIPLPKGKDNQWIIELDGRTFKEDLEQRMAPHKIPVALVQAIQGYFYSSFNAGWEQISAASGWNFVAAEEYGRIVFPGGNAGLTDALWQRVRDVEQKAYGRSGVMLRAGCRVVDVRVMKTGKLIVTYREGDGPFRSMIARRVVMCCPKHIARNILRPMQDLDPEKFDALHSIETNSYLVANVLLNAAIKRDFYDLFLLGDGNFPTTPNEFEERPAVTDVVSGHFTRGAGIAPSVLTLYWPLPSSIGRRWLIRDDVWVRFTTDIVPQIRRILGLLDVPESAVRQVRMTRWGHAFPVAEWNRIADGTCEKIQRPIAGKVFFVSQDNWLLPAVDNTLLDCGIYVPQIEAGL
ncbi:MAG TPA: NAD(P)-binding protein [Phycisphaerales bacterium]|nr:NAD(P)-binding protein [Phycisphaerales bacterium]